MQDGEIRDHVRDALLQDLAFDRISIVEILKNEPNVVRDAGTAAMGEIRIEVADGIVTLSGDVPGLEHKRLAGVLAWWVPGSRDVVNGIGVDPPEEDSDDATTDAVRTVLEKDPFVDASQIRVETRERVVTLDGLVPTETEREMAEFDAWSVFGVDKVVSRIAVRRQP
jgi:osmotically-inducible protein OsmY